MKKNIRVDGKRIYLKTLIEDDASEEYVGWINDKDVNQYLETKRTTLEELRSYITKKKEDENCLFLGIYFKENNKHIGNIKLEPIDLDEIDLGVLKDNAAAIRVYEKAGFKIKAEKEKGFTMSRRRMP
jgi:RimJ/RimL family protein N-acetyltransferase